MTWKQKIEFAKIDERIFDGFKCSFYVENLKFAFFSILSSAKWKFFVVVGWNQVYWDFIAFMIELVQGNNKRIYWKNRRYNA